MSTLHSVKFRAEREDGWRHLEALVEAAEQRGLDSLTAEQLHLLPILYRMTVSSLSVARATSLERGLPEYLERLSARAHLVLHRPRVGLWRGLAQALTETLPNALREARGLIGLTLFTLVLGVLVGHGLVAADPAEYDSFVPEALANGRGPTSSTESLRAVLYSKESLTETLVSFAAFLFAHNSQIALGCISLGILAGVPVLLLAFSNGLTVGAFSALYASRGLLGDVWLWLLPHGVTELLAIAVAGAAGLGLAAGWLFPGPHSRSDALRLAGRRAARLAAAAVVMLFFAALIEGIVRQELAGAGRKHVVIVRGPTRRVPA